MINPPRTLDSFLKTALAGQGRFKLYSPRLTQPLYFESSHEAIREFWLLRYGLRHYRSPNQEGPALNQVNLADTEENNKLISVEFSEKYLTQEDYDFDNRE
jgi:hypothetical protein